LECYNKGFISLRLVILGYTDVRLRLRFTRFTSRAAFCAASSLKCLKYLYWNGELSEFLKCVINCDNLCLNGDLQGDKCENIDHCLGLRGLRGDKCKVRCVKAGKLPLFYNDFYNDLYNCSDHFKHVFRPIQAVLAEIEALQNLSDNCENFSLRGPDNAKVYLRFYNFSLGGPFLFNLKVHLYEHFWLSFLFNLKVHLYEHFRLSFFV
jgi:hypothetical protein